MKKMIVLVSVATLFLLMSGVALSREVKGPYEGSVATDKCDCPIYFRESSVKIWCDLEKEGNYDCTLQYGGESPLVPTPNCAPGDNMIFTSAIVKSDPQKRTVLFEDYGGIDHGAPKKDVLLITTCLKSE